MFETNGGMTQYWQRYRNDGEIKVRGLSKIESIISCGFDTSCKHVRFDRRSGALTYPFHIIFEKTQGENLKEGVG